MPSAPSSGPSLGIFKHEMAARRPRPPAAVPLEDQPNGLFYRYTPPAGTWGSGAALDGGVLEAMAVDGAGAVTWIRVDTFADPEAPAGPLRTAVVGATPFDGGEGVVYDEDRVYLTTKGDDRVWVHDIGAQTMRVLYDGSSFPTPVLDGVDNIMVSAAHDIYVAEDGGNLEVCMITPDLVVAPVVQMTGPQHGFDSPASRRSRRSRASPSRPTATACTSTPSGAGTASYPSVPGRGSSTR